MKGRTAKDEAEFVEHLRREEPIKTEVIIELHNTTARLLQNQETLLEELIRAGDALRTYRSELLEQTKRAIQHQTHCVPGCTRHDWDDVKGWVRKEPTK